jgi:hypothetical protein
MKSKQTKKQLKLEKFKVAKINNPALIIGGDGEGDGNLTQATTDKTSFIIRK